MTKAVIGKRGILVLLLCCGLLAVCAGCKEGSDSTAEKTEFEIDEQFERGPLSVHVRIDKSKLTIAETFLLEFEAVIEPGYEVRMPKVDKVLENFGIVDWNNLGNKLDENNNVASTYRYRLEPFLSGKYEVPAFTFEFYDVNSVEDKKYELSSEPLEVEVTSLLGEQRGELVIEDIEDVVEMPQEASLRWVWFLIIAFVAAVAGVWIFLRRKRVAKLIRIFKPAHEIAYDRLKALVQENLVEAGKIKEFYERISSILRHYIEHRFELRAPERTTEEFLAELKYTDVLSASDKESLEEFLTHCDLVKFAKHTPATEQIQQTFDLVKDFIEKTKSDERRIDVTDNLQEQKNVEAEVA
ncbi:MAG: protein BatD [Planctomycetes bacterium]|nr:protein BatD [Planctomycetota bacterium]